MCECLCAGGGAAKRACVVTIDHIVHVCDASAGLLLKGASNLLRGAPEIKLWGINCLWSRWIAAPLVGSASRLRDAVVACNHKTLLSETVPVIEL